MKRIACPLLILAVLGSAVIFVVEVQAATSVEGFITSDTIWSVANSPYQLNGVVAVNNDVILTIEAGVTVDFNSWYMQVDGALDARGASDNKITLTSQSHSINQRIIFSASSTTWNEQTGTGSIIEYANLDKVYLTISGSPKINKNTINSRYTLSVDDGSPVISNNEISCTDSVLYVKGGGSATVSGNVIMGSGSGSIFGISVAVDTTVFNNTVTNCAAGIHATNYSTINGNRLLSNGDGILNTAAVTAQNNLIANNSVGINGGSGVFENNAITANSKAGIEFSAPPTAFSNNNIYNNTLNVIVKTASDVTATNNWWGTTNIEAINQTIYDKKNNADLGRVIFTPTLTAPNPEAPSISDVATPTPAPTPSITPTLPEETPDTSIEPTSTASSQPSTVDSSDSVIFGLSWREITVIAIVAIGISWLIVLAVILSRKAYRR